MFLTATLMPKHSGAGGLWRGIVFLQWSAPSTSTHNSLMIGCGVPTRRILWQVREFSLLPRAWFQRTSKARIVSLSMQRDNFGHENFFCDCTYRLTRHLCRPTRCVEGNPFLWPLPNLLMLAYHSGHQFPCASIVRALINAL